MEIKNLVELPLLKHKIFKWEDKKIKIKKIIDNINLEKCEHFLSSKNVKCEDFKKSFVDIFSEDLNKISDYVKDELILQDVWIVSYEKGNEHYIHNHGQTGLSGVIYLDYDENEHESTKYLIPFNNPITNNSVIVSEKVKEGDMIVTPSLINHFVPYNKSNKIRSIIGFDLKFN